MIGSGGVAVSIVGSERFCRSDALNRVLSRPLGAGFGRGHGLRLGKRGCSCDGDSNNQGQHRTRGSRREWFGRSEFRNSCQRKILVCFPRNRARAQGVLLFRENIGPPPLSPGPY
jgi:hypothetical protein